MTYDKFLKKTAEAVSPAHPDKLCDQISDYILDECLKQDPYSRVAVEVCGGHGTIFITGEITSKAKVDYIKAVKTVLKDNRYNPEEYRILENISKQSQNIANGVDTGGAGDQGIMVGYATRETPEMIPYELQEARSILKDLWDTFEEARDMKAQVTTRYGVIDTVVVSAERLKKETILKYLRLRYQQEFETINFFINPAGEWDNGGFESDAGLTGRKLAVDNYGPQVEIGGGAFSGKDATKVDRSGAYLARKIAVNYLKENTSATFAKVKVAYSIGIAKPVMITIESNNHTENITPDDNHTPEGIIKLLNLRNPKFYQTAKWGHFGNDFEWDK